MTIVPALLSPRNRVALREKWGYGAAWVDAMAAAFAREMHNFANGNDQGDQRQSGGAKT